MAKEPAEQVSGEEVVGTGNDARLKLLQQINDQNDAQLAQSGDMLDVNDDNTTTAFAPEGELTDEEIAQRELDRAAEEANQTGEEDEQQTAPQKFKIKVNGTEREVTQQELIDLAQKADGAEQKFQEAARLRREAETLTKPNPQSPSPEDIATQAAEERRALVRAIQMGSEEEALAAVDKLMGATHPSVSADDVARTVDERLTFNDAVTRFQTEYKDLVTDPVLLNIVLNRDKELIAQGDKRVYWDRYQEIGTEVREWLKTIAKPEPDPAKPSDKQTRKASASPVPKGASIKAPQATDDEDKEESTSEIISNIAKARGGPQWLRG